MQAALDLADHYIAVLNQMDGCPDLEDGGEDEPSLAAPENHEGSQIVYMRGGDQDREAEAPETTLPEVSAEEMIAVAVIQDSLMCWGGRGNVVAAAGTVLLDLAGVR